MINIYVVIMSTAFMLCFGTNAFPATNAEVEVMMTMATIQYQAKDFAKCRQTLTEVIRKDQSNIGARELLALTERQLGDDSAAAKTYELLLNSGSLEKLPAYHFELATIRYKQKMFNVARKHFNIAANANFNAGTSHFFLGVIEFSAKEWRKARNHLAASLTYSDAKAMEPVTRYYLANSYAQLGKSDVAIRNYYETEKAIKERETSGSGIDSLTKGIRTSALKELKALDQDQRFASISLLQQFDSNVQTNPSEVENSATASKQRSAKSVLNISAGYSTSPTRKVQVTPTFNYYTNYNYNYQARNFNFMSFTPAVFAVYKPYARLSAGLKADGIFSMQNMLDPEESTQHLKYRPFSLTGDVGPVFKYEFSTKISLAGEAYWRPKHFYLDPASGDSRRSGGGVFGKLSADYVSGFTWWNPMAYMSYEWDHPSGKDFQMSAIGGGVANTLFITEKFSLTGSFDLLSTDYNETKPKRDDVSMVTRLAGSYPINAHWLATADLSYTNNDSSLTTVYKYNRWVASTGATYSF